MKSAAKNDGSIGRRSGRYERQRARIIDAAVALVNEKGVGGMTLQEVAKALDLTTTSVTYYYRYKEHLAAEVFEDTLVRLGSMAADAAKEDTPQERVARYVEIFFDQFVDGSLGRDRPLAILSEIRTLEAATRQHLIEHYQEVFRAVRSLFGDTSCESEKRLNSVRAQFLNEALFWAALWLGRYPKSDIKNVLRRTLDILAHGISASHTCLEYEVLAIDGEHPVDAKRNFLQAASRLINDIGYKGASIDRIVSELKLTKGSFYHHLDTKDDLIQACYSDDYDRLAQLQAMIDQCGGRVIDRLTKAIFSVLAIQFEGRHPLLRTTALQAMPPAVRKVALERYDRLALSLSGMLVDGMVDGSVRALDPVIAGNIIISTLNSAYDMRGWANRQRREDAIRTYANILLRGLFG